MSQSSFNFDSPQDQAPTVPKNVASDSPMSLEQMAERLEQDADYRVLRRLVPVMDYGPLQGGDNLDDSPATSQRVLVIDTETTGLSHAADKIIELAMLLVEVDTASGLPRGQVETFEGFEDPGMPIPEVSRGITGITDEMVQGQRLDDQQVAAMVERADLVVAHNAGFDRPFVESRFPGFAQKPWACSFMDIDWKAMGAESAKLSALARDQGWFFDAHRALVDCHALLQVLSSRGEADPITGLNRLMTAGAQPSFKLRATGAPFESKDKLKSRGYRWDGDGRVWFRNLGNEEALASELVWLKAEVYGSRRAQLEVEALDGLTRYSPRTGRMETRSV